VIFLVRITKSSISKLGYIVQLRFSVTQHSRDEELLKSLVSFLGCGIYYARSEHNFGEFIVTKFSDITDKIIAFFEKYPIQGVKSLDSTEFKRVAELMKNKDHLSQEGLEQIRQIKAGMDSPFPPATPPS
jgi:hypothetical protein